MDHRSIGSLRSRSSASAATTSDAASTRPRPTRVVHAALDAGINFFDTADIYGGTKSEEFLGRALGRTPRARVIATKFGMPMDDQRKGARPTYVRQRVDDSLRRLGTDHIDLYQLHRRIRTCRSPTRSARWTTWCRPARCARSAAPIFPPSNSTRPTARVRPGAARFVSVQNEYSLLHREPERERAARVRAPGTRVSALLPAGERAADRQVPAQDSRRPQAARLSPAWAHDSSPTRTSRIAEALNALRRGRGHTLLELAFSWLRVMAAVASVIAGATSPEQVRANAAAVNWSMSREELAEIDRLTR